MRILLLICSGGYHKNYAQTFFRSSAFVSVCVFNVWPKTTLLLPVWPRDAKRLDTPELQCLLQGIQLATSMPVTALVPAQLPLQSSMVTFVG